MIDSRLTNPEIRRVFEEELLVGEATDTLAALIEELGISQRDLAARLGVSEGRVSQILSGASNLSCDRLPDWAGHSAWSSSCGPRRCAIAAAHQLMPTLRPRHGCTSCQRTSSPG